MFGFGNRRNHHDRLIDYFLDRMKDPEAKWIYNGQFLQLANEDGRDKQELTLKKNEEIMLDGNGKITIIKVVMKVGSVEIKHYDFSRKQRKRLISAYDWLVCTIAIKKITGNETLLLT